MGTELIPLARPDIDASDVEAVLQVLKSGRLSQGPALEAFEARFAGYHGLDSAVGVSSGTAGLMLALDAVGVGPGDEVITVSLSFSATANSVVRLGARPVFVDVRRQDLNMDPSMLAGALSERTRAIVVVHLFGEVADMPAVNAFASRHGLPVVEDACEALGARGAAGLAGTLGDVAVFGFYANKPITTAEGGMVISRDAKLAQRCRQLRNHGRDADGDYSAPVAGFNFRLSELHAALGVSQLARLPRLLEKRETLAGRYARALRGVDAVEPPAHSADGARRAWFTYPVRLDPALAPRRDEIRKDLRAAGVESGDYFPPIHLLPYYRELGANGHRLPVTEAEARRTLALPLYAGMSLAQVDEVAARLKRVIERRRRP